MPKRRGPFDRSERVEAQYARDLRKIAREIGRIVEGFNITDPSKFPPLRSALEKYAEIVKPWAETKARMIVESVARQDQEVWANATKAMSKELQKEIRSTPLGQELKRLMQEQVTLITSLPLKAAERVHKLVIENSEQSGRAKEIANEIKRSGKVAESRATLIARTEVSRTASVLTQVRAESIGSAGYVWRTAHDGDVRKSHKKMEGKFVAWDKPPTLDNLTGHAGALPNCRCYPEPVIPEIIE